MFLAFFTLSQFQLCRGFSLTRAVYVQYLSRSLLLILAETGGSELLGAYVLSLHG